ncbi:uncharacterized protein LOC135377874 isoform X2 [Ornithodoros turicata]
MDSQGQEPNSEVMETSSSNHAVLLTDMKLLEEPSAGDLYVQREFLEALGTNTDVVPAVEGSSKMILIVQEADLLEPTPPQDTEQSVPDTTLEPCEDVVPVAETYADSETEKLDRSSGNLQDDINKTHVSPAHSPVAENPQETPGDEVTAQDMASEECDTHRSALPRQTRQMSPSFGLERAAHTPRKGTNETCASEVSTKAVRTPMSPLIAAAASCEEPTPTKSLPSKMERMQFNNSLDLDRQSLESPRKTPLQTYLRLQNSTPRARSAYNCQKCSFRTSRMENLVRHNKSECAFIKDFFSWDANTFTEVAKRKEVCPTDIVENVTPTIAATTPVKRKGQPRERLDVQAKLARMEPIEKKKSNTPIKSKSAGSAEEESSDSDIGPISSAEATDLEFSEDDVVWVEWKRLHWPALVLKVYANTKKAKVFLIDTISSKETVMINVKKIFNFNSAERNKRFLNEGRVGRNSGALVKAVQKAEEFLRKRCLGIHINAKQFFCDGEVQLIDDYSENSSSSCMESELWSCSPASQEGEGDRENAEASKERRRRRNEKLVKCITTGKVDSHLFGVLNGTIASERHEKFHSDVQCDRSQLKQQSWFGPIDDTSQQEKIYEYCFELLKRTSNVDESFDIAAYVIEVWCPEAVMKALCRTRRINMSRAEEILTRAVVLSKAEHEVAHRQMLAASPTPDERKEHEEQIRSNFRDMGIEDEILAALDF